MQPVAVLVVHRTRPGQRDAVRAVWERHVPSAVSDNPGHLAYHDCLDAAEPDTSCGQSGELTVMGRPSRRAASPLAGQDVSMQR